MRKACIPFFSNDKAYVVYLHARADGERADQRVAHHALHHHSGNGEARPAHHSQSDTGQAQVQQNATIQFGNFRKQLLREQMISHHFKHLRHRNILNSKGTGEGKQ